MTEEPQVDSRLAPWPASWLRLRLAPGTAVFVVATAVLWAWLVRRPLWHTDLWGHLSYGRWIVEHGGLPLREPFLLFSADKPLIDTAWLSQVIGYRLHRLGGPAALQYVYATLVTACALVLAWPGPGGRGRLPAGVAGAALFLAVDWQQLAIIRPQLAGLLCFVVLWRLVDRPHDSRLRQVLLVLLMTLWANLHGSFVVGLLVLAAVVAGRVIDRLRRTGQLKSLWCDRVARLRLRQLVLAVLAVLVTPYGLRLPAAVLAISSHPNLLAVVEWQPLNWSQSQSRAMLAATGLVGVVLWLSRRRVRAVEWLLLVGLGVAACLVSRMIAWWAPVAGALIVSHGRGLPRRLAAQSPQETRPPRAGWSVAAGLVIVAAVVTAPATWSILRHQPDDRGCFSEGTPVEAAEWLLEHPPRGTVLAMYEWSDFLVWAGPPDTRPLVGSHAHLLPESVWQDYWAVIHVEPRWRSVLAKYGVSTIVLDRNRAIALSARLADDPAWRLDYQDRQAEVWTSDRPKSAAGPRRGGPSSHSAAGTGS